MDNSQLVNMYVEAVTGKWMDAEKRHVSTEVQLRYLNAEFEAKEKIYKEQLEKALTEKTAILAEVQELEKQKKALSNEAHEAKEKATRLESTLLARDQQIARQNEELELRAREIAKLQIDVVSLKPAPPKAKGRKKKVEVDDF